MPLSSPCSLLIRFISNPSAPTWWGFLVAGLMFMCSMMQTLLLHQYFYCVFGMALRFRTAIIGVIYRKVGWNGVLGGQPGGALERLTGPVHHPAVSRQALVITSSAKRESTVGEIVNLMSVDAQRFVDLAPFLNLLWSAPLQIILTIYFLWQVTPELWLLPPSSDLDLAEKGQERAKPSQQRAA